MSIENIDNHISINTEDFGKYKLIILIPSYLNDSDVDEVVNLISNKLENYFILSVICNCGRFDIKNKNNKKVKTIMYDLTINVHKQKIKIVKKILQDCKIILKFIITRYDKHELGRKTRFTDPITCKKLLFESFHMMPRICTGLSKKDQRRFSKDTKIAMQLGLINK